MSADDEDGFTIREAAPALLSALREVSDIARKVLISFNPEADPPEAPEVAVYMRREFGRIRDEAERLREEAEDLFEPEVMVEAVNRWEERDRRERARREEEDAS